MEQGQAHPASSLVEHLFRHESGRMVSAMTRIFGLHNLALAEDVVQEAFVKAFQEWRLNPIPPNPSAWLMLTARNKAIDAVRRNRHQVEFSEDIACLLNSEYTAVTTVNEMFLDDEVADSQLRMIFTCCHPALPAEMQIPADAQDDFRVRNTGDRQRPPDEQGDRQQAALQGEAVHQENGVKFEIPAGGELTSRLDMVYTVMYLLFNEGYNSGKADELIRKDLCAEAMRLCLLLSDHRVGKRPKTYALLSLMCFHASRFDSRMNSDNEIVLLQDQDRSAWDRDLISRGEEYLSLASEGDEVSEFHIEAAISAQHCMAARFEETDWRAIAALYDALLALKRSPLVKLNRAVVLARIHGPESGD